MRRRWVTRRQIRVNRTATDWLVKRFIDSDAEFLFVEPDAVGLAQRDMDAIGFDASGARSPHKDEHGRRSFEAPSLPRVVRVAAGGNGSERRDAASKR